MIYLIPGCAIAILLSITAAALYRRLPPAWLCEYGQLPGREHDRSARLVKGTHGVFLSAGAAVLMMIFYYGHTSAELSGTGSPPALQQDNCTLLIGDASYLAAGFVILAAASLGDMEYRIIADPLCAALFVLGGMRGAVYALGYGAYIEAAGTVLGGVLLCGGLMLAVSLITMLIYRTETIGMGDIKLLGAGGAYCSAAWMQHDWIAASIFVFCTAVILSGICSAVLLITHRVRPGDGLPMGPWIAAAVLLCTAAAC